MMWLGAKREMSSKSGTKAQASHIPYAGHASASPRRSPRRETCRCCPSSRLAPARRSGAPTGQAAGLAASAACERRGRRPGRLARSPPAGPARAKQRRRQSGGRGPPSLARPESRPRPPARRPPVGGRSRSLLACRLEAAAARPATPALITPKSRVWHVCRSPATLPVVLAYSF